MASTSDKSTLSFVKFLYIWSGLVTFSSAFQSALPVTFLKSIKNNEIYRSDSSSPLIRLDYDHVRYSRGKLSRRHMALIPIPRGELTQLITTNMNLPTPAQYLTYWGRTSREQYNSLFEAFGVSFLGVFFSYFMSFAIGQFVATILGTVFGFWVLLGPEFKAYNRNWELTAGRELIDPWDNDYDDDFVDKDKQGLYGAFYFGRIEEVCVVESPTSPASEEYSLDDFDGYTMEKDELDRATGMPYNLRLRVTDDDKNGRELQIHARMSEEYLDLERGMPVCSVLLSPSRSFDSLAGLTDFCVPDAGPCWVGDYPYLDRAILEDIFVTDHDLWDTLREEGRGEWE
jgi:hypothetical protein